MYICRSQEICKRKGLAAKSCKDGRVRRFAVDKMRGGGIMGGRNGEDDACEIFFKKHTGGDWDKSLLVLYVEA